MLIVYYSVDLAKVLTEKRCENLNSKYMKVIIDMCVFFESLNPTYLQKLECGLSSKSKMRE
jgi:hypothetical protein